MEPLTPDDVQAALDAWDLGIQIRHLDTSAATSQLAAEALGCELGQIAKSLCFMVDDKPILVVASGDQRVDDRKLRTLFNVSRKKLRIAAADECVEVFGYEPGGVPPLGHRAADLQVLLDDSLNRYSEVYAAGGAHDAIFGVAPDQLAHISRGQFADVRRQPGEATGE